MPFIAHGKEALKVLCHANRINNLATHLQTILPFVVNFLSIMGSSGWMSYIMVAFGGLRSYALLRGLLRGNIAGLSMMVEGLIKARGRFVKTGWSVMGRLMVGGSVEGRVSRIRGWRMNGGVREGKFGWRKGVRWSVWRWRGVDRRCVG